MSAQSSISSKSRSAEAPDLDLVDAGVDRFLANPGAYFGGSLTKMMGLSTDALNALQLAGLKRRFEQFRGTLPMLTKLAERQNINSIERFEDVLPLLFDHATYKSYPASLLDKHRYKDLTAWLQKLTTVDLSNANVADCRSIDDWMIALKRDTPLSITHTSGTSGTMSFLPWSKKDFLTLVRQFPVVYFQRFGEESPVPDMPMNIECIFPYFRTGGLTNTVLNDAIVALIAGDESRFHAAYPERQSADLARLAARRRAAEAKGQLDRLEVSPELAARRDEFEAQQRNMPQHIEAFFETVSSTLAGRQVFMLATTNLLFSFAEKGLKRGLRRIFSADSVIITGGGGKGMVLPDNWQAMVREFFGVDHLFAAYGMSEMCGQFPSCEHGHYHAPPWVIPFILDSETGEVLPRHGTVTGRFAFFDLLPDARWGGFVTGDEVTMSWDKPCDCGRTGPYVHAKIQRFSDKKDFSGEEKINCAAAPDAYAEALDFLNEGVG